ncbi:MAG: thiamine pyrophosphate enzyme-like TPP-binding protein [Rhodospirillales bacterium]|jgi:acetolactate synthase-1/2/3 large subunit|nr:thiamine pyrophosphate enzyme-like TPP-binding protein [Rhodospirillales bacterium]
MTIKTLSDVTVAEAYLTLLAERGIDYLFANAGSDFGPIIEGLTRAGSGAGLAPTPITCPHENTALHMAIGYYLVTGRMQAVMVHTNVGTANGLMGLMNASRGGVPMLYSAGRTPINEDTYQGHRDMDINWTQEMFDQAGILRESVKWDYELRNAPQLETVVDRALSVARSEPAGPVYLTLPREVIAQRLEKFSYSVPGRLQPASPPAPDPATLEQVATLLINAENPLIVASQAGRQLDVMAPLGALAEKYAIPVIQYRNRFVSLASDHPMNMGFEPRPLLGEADVILVLDSVVPWLPHQHKLKEGAVVINMAPDPLYRQIPIRGHQSDIALTTTVGLGLTLLAAAMAGPSKAKQAVIDARRKKIVDLNATMLDNRKRLLEEKKTATPIHPAWLSHCIDQVKDADSIVIVESGLMQEYVMTTRPGTLFSATAASGLGAGTGTALGAKLASPDKFVIGTYGDGSYMFGNPVASHFVSAESNLPLLHIVFNNNHWGAVRNSTNRVMPNGYAQKSNRPPLTYLDTANKYEKAVEVADGYGEAVNDPAKLMGALERARKVVEIEKRQALLNVRCS